METYPKDYKKKYWDKLYEEAKEQVEKEFGVRVDAVKLTWNVFLILGLALLGSLIYGVSIVSQVTLGREVISIPEYLLGIFIGLFMINIWGIVWLNWVAVPATAHFRKFDLAAGKDFEKEKAITAKQLEMDELKRDTELAIGAIPDLLPTPIEIDIEKKYIGLEVYNLNKNRKRVELSVFSHIVFSHALGSDGKIGDGDFQGKNFVWADNQKETVEINPERKSKLMVLTFSNNKHFSIGGFSNKVREETFFEVELIFKGKYEGENHFRERRENRAIYISKFGEVFFSNFAVVECSNMSPQMREAMNFVNNGVLYINRPSEH